MKYDFDVEPRELGDFSNFFGLAEYFRDEGAVFRIIALAAFCVSHRFAGRGFR